MRYVALLAILVLAASCAPAGSAPPPSGTATRPPAIRSEVNNGEGYEFVLRGEAASNHELALAGTLESAWASLERAYRTLGIPVTHADPTAREIGTSGSSLRGRVGETPLAAYLDCGRVLGGPIAGTYRIRLSVVSMLRPGPDSAPLLTTRVAATASDPGSSGASVRCNSTGELEKRIAALTAAG